MAIDSSVVSRKWMNFDFNSPAIQSMAKALSPAFFRLGGTAADLVIFKLDTEDEYDDGQNAHGSGFAIPGDDFCVKPPRHNFTMSARDWVLVNHFSESVGWHFLFDINVLLRKGLNWDSSNISPLLEFSSKQGFVNITWELGNEPNSLHHQLNFSLPGSQLGRDFAALRLVLNRFPLYRNSMIVGPDINHVGGCRPGQKTLCKALRYLDKVLTSSEGVIGPVTYHQYYLDGHIATIKDFLSVQTLSEFESEIEVMREFLSERHLKNDLWLGETSSAYGGGAKGLSDRYVAGFLWLHKLGAAALGHHKVVIRQTFYHGCYALIGEDLLPNPDFWISVLHKRLVGTKVLDLKGKTLNTLRLYAHCDKDGRGVTLFGFNLANERTWFGLEQPLDESPIDHYVLGPENLTGREIKLNGELLRLEGDGSLPKMAPFKTGPMSWLAMKPFEMAFWHFKNVSVKACSREFDAESAYSAERVSRH